MFYYLIGCISDDLIQQRILLIVNRPYDAVGKPDTRYVYHLCARPLHRVDEDGQCVDDHIGAVGVEAKKADALLVGEALQIGEVIAQIGVSEGLAVLYASVLIDFVDVTS